MGRHAVAAEPMQSALDFLTADETEARYLEAAESSLGLAQGIEPRLHPGTEQEVKSLGAMPRVLIYTDPSDRFLARSVRAASRRLRALGAIPIGVDRKGNPATGESIDHLLEAAERGTERAGGSLAKTEANLAQLAASSDEIDAVYWLWRQPKTGHLQTILASSAEGKGADSAPPVQGSCTSTTAPRLSH